MIKVYYFNYSFKHFLKLTLNYMIPYEKYKLLSKQFVLKYFDLLSYLYI